MKHFAATTAIVVLLFSTAGQASPTFGQVDDFEDGTTQNWMVGLANPFVPVNIPTGGPAGMDDNYMQIQSDPDVGLAGSNLGVFNTAQWTGNFTAAGVTAVEVDMANFGAVPLEMRVFLCGPTGCFTDGFSTTLAQALPADGVWHSLVFDISPAAFTAVGGIDPVAALQGVTQFMFRHDAGEPSGAGGSTEVEALVGVDNVQAVPEPTTITLLALGALCLLRRRKH